MCMILYYYCLIKLHDEEPDSSKAQNAQIRQHAQLNSVLKLVYPSSCFSTTHVVTGLTHKRGKMLPLRIFTERLVLAKKSDANNS